MKKISNLSGCRFLRSFGLGLAVFLIGSLSLSAQNAVRISEVQSLNANGYVDEFGHRGAWLEFNNVTAASTNIAGMYLTDDPANPTKYPIRSGSQKTTIAPHQTFVIFLDGMSDRGVMHSGLLLDPKKETTIYLYEGDGENLVDQVTVPVMKAGQSYARIEFEGKEKKGDFQIVETATPNEPNSYVHGKENVGNFKQQDPFGLVMTIIAMSVVFGGLLLLYFVFGSMGNLFTRRDEKNAPAPKSPKKEQSKAATLASAPSKGQTPEGAQAAIAMALYDYQNSGIQAAIALAIYETELSRNRQTGMINLRRDPAASPWTNKALTLRRLPNF